MKIDMLNLKDATEQQVFEQAARHLLTQNAKSSKSATAISVMVRYAYRGDDGMKCGAGCFLSDEQYLPRYENLLWQSVAGIFKERSHVHLIGEIQCLHDDLPIEHWKGEFIEIGRLRKLDVSFIHEEFK